MKSILVLGATGNLGAYITLHFHKLGWRVIAASRRKDDGGFFADYAIPYYSVDITDKASFAQLPTDIDVVADFAGDLPASMEGYVAERYINSIIKGTFNVLEWMRENKIPRIIFPQTLFDIHYLFGSREPISADAEKRVPLVGDHQMYVIAKMAAVEMIEMYLREYGLQRFIVRLSKVYQYHPNHYTFTDGKKTLINDWFFISKAEKGEPIEIWGDPTRVLETCHVEDFLQIIEKCATVTHDGGIYNIGSGGSSLEERIRAIIDVFGPEGHKSEVTYAPDKPLCSQYILDISKTKKELGYEPRYNWHDYCVWLKNERAAQRFAKIWGTEADYE